MISIVIVLIAAALTGGVIAGARFSPLAPLPYAFDVCDGAACFMGITPGHTRFQAALQAIRQSEHEIVFNFNRILAFNVVEPTLTYDQLNVVVNGSPYGRDEQASVGYILIQGDGTRPHMPEVGPFLLHYGPPCGVVLLGGGRVQMIYRDMILIVHTRREALTAKSAIMTFSLGAPDPRNSSAPDRCAQHAQTYGAKWHGLAHINRYPLWAGE
jgi:hypothetical protein